nr:FG-GAP-like repeat-containing protein [Synechocystis sp. LEGE 06083]
MADIDGDGDLDAIVGEFDRNLKYFQNTGSNTAPVYTEQTGTANPFNGINIRIYSKPTLADLDGDGDLDAIVGGRNGTLKYFQNTGSSTAPVYTEQTGTANPFDGINVGSFSAPTFADLDGDGDLDAIVGESYGTLRYYQNTGSSTAPVYTEQTGTANPFDGIDIGSYSAPTLADLDGDGDLDAIIGELNGTLKYYQNTGSSTAPVYTAQTGTANPFNGINIGSLSAPTFADIDGDGDLDAIVGENDGTLKYFQSVPAIAITPTGGNTQVTEGGATDSYTVVLNVQPSADVTIALNGGTQLSTNVTSLTFTSANWDVPQTVTVTAVDDTVGEGPHQGVITSTVSSTDLSYNGLTVASVVAQITDNDLPTTPRIYIAQTGIANAQTGTANPFNGIDIGFYSAPTLADLDGDGDLDVIIGEQDGTLNYYENTGSSTAPVYTERTGTANPFNGIDIGTYSSPTFADIDGDGDLDAIIGDSYGTLNYYENTGSSTAPVYTERTGTANPFNGIDVGTYSSPTFADIDGDGDLDAIIGESDGTLNYYENTGSSTAPVYTERTGTANPFNGIDVRTYSSPTLADIDGDGDLDAVIGESDGNLNYYENTGSNTAPVYTERTGSANPFNGIDIGSYSKPTFADIDGDGDLDAVIGEYYGNLNYFKSVIPKPGIANPNPFNGIDVGYFSSPTFADLDGDGDLDAVIGESDNNLNYYENTGSSTAPVYTERTGTANPFNGIGIGYFSSPTFAYLDGDGDLDAIIGERDGNLKYYENTGSNTAPVYTERTGTANPFNGIDVGGYSAPTLADLDGDGDLDAIIGERDGNLKYYENTGSSNAPVYTERTGTANPFNGIDVGTYSAPTFADIDGDGDLDAFIGEQDGTLNYYENTGSNTAPVYTERTGSANPFNGIDIGSYSKPTFADIDGDGDLDAVIGDLYGNLYYFESVIPNSAPTITSGTTANFAENGTGTVYTVTATDPENDSITYGLETTGDYLLFDIDSNTGIVTFKTSPDFENPTDIGTDNVYDITVTASDGLLSDSQAIVITVTDVNEASSIDGNDAANFLFGTGKNDLIRGFGGNDILLGNGGNDTLYGGEGNDILNGGFGDDVLIGGLGTDKLIGGLGKDKFVYKALNEAGDVILDFNRNQDQLILTELFTSLDYAGTDPIADGYLRFNRLGFSTQVQIDADGLSNGSNYTTLTTLIGVFPSSLSVGTNVVI